MTSPSLRNLRIIRSVTPTAITTDLWTLLVSRLKSGARLAICGLAAVAAITDLASQPVVAQQRVQSGAELGNQTREEAAVPLIQATRLRVTPAPAQGFSQPTARGTVMRAVVVETANDNATRRVQPASGVMPMPQETAALPPNAPSIADQQRAELVRCIDAAAYHRQQNQTWAAHFQHRMQCVVQGESGNAAAGAGRLEWWHNQTAANQTGTHRDRLQQFVADHTLPGYDESEVDVYDSKPRVVAYGPVRTASAHQETQLATGGIESASSRLNRDITNIQPTLSYALKGIEPSQLPDDFFEKMDNGQYVAETTSPTVFQWAPTNLYHNPLYFEDPALERYGHTYHPLVQPFASTGRFATQLVGLPYQMTLRPVHAREYSLGWYRPGDYAPKKHYQIPFNEEATLMQVAVVAGLILIFP